MDVLRFVPGGVRPPPLPTFAAPVSAAPAPSPHAAAASPAPGFHSPLLGLWPRRRGGGAENALGAAVAAEAAAGVEEARDRRRRRAVEGEDDGRGGGGGNWVLQILRVQSSSPPPPSPSRDEGPGSGEGDGSSSQRCAGRCGAGPDSEEGCSVADAEELDRAAFSRLLRKVSLAEAKLYSRMSGLCNFAYMVPRIKPRYLQKYNMTFVTSSVEERAKLPNPCNQDQNPNDRKNTNRGTPSRHSDEQESTYGTTSEHERMQEHQSGQGINPLAAYRIAASAASYVQSRAMEVLPFGSQSEGRRDRTIQAIVNAQTEGLTMDEASFVATTNSMTSMVAAKEETKQAVADDLNSSRSCPCEWFICDENQSSTRYFVIQGSETIASWQANLLFEPTKFEGLDVLSFTGGYMRLPKGYTGKCYHMSNLTLLVMANLLALLVNLMFLIRGVAPAASLLPVITFGSPSVMCGGDYLLQKLGLPKSHVQSITLHRDIVPRAFSCHYPDHIASILKLVNGNFRSHPCLTNQKLLYAPMGEVFILQPDEKLSPHHHLLPAGSGLYLIGGQAVDSDTSSTVLRSALSAFFNSPHPLEILREAGAYGPKGTVYRDHDVHSYLRSIRAVLRKEMRAEKERRRRLLRWPIEVYGALATIDRRHVLRQLRRHAHLLVVFLLPAKLLFLGVLSVIRPN
ncbi:unnamed protein product [Miscanthus lutarioriparius]|uniref:Fungal lipase-type domain-containing protein n=1 Tax=Miscanthus lutarioriparius TaxID=422564 RepID=A0A811SJF0_9POAL|nr:unnamed protein product [Miscanthus lutarioriparius]